MAKLIRMQCALPLLILVVAVYPGRAQASDAVALSGGIENIARRIGSQLSQKQRTTLAVLPFTDLQGQQTKLGKYIAEQLTTDLVGFGGFEIVERSRIDSLLSEYSLGQSGLIKASTVQKVGKIAGVDAVVTGTITEFRSYLAVNTRVIETETGRVFAAAEADVVKDAEIAADLVPIGSPPGHKGGGQQQNTEPVPEQVAYADDFKFSVSTCSKSGGGTVHCSLMVTNEGRDRSMFPVAARLIDNSGGQYRAVEASIGDHAHRGFEVGGSSSLLVSDVPVRGNLRFTNLPTSSSEAVLLEIEISVPQEAHGGFSGGSSGRSMVRFHHVPLVSK